MRYCPSVKTESHEERLDIPIGDLCFRHFGLRQCIIRTNRKVCIQYRIESLDSVKEQSCELYRRDLFVLEGRCQRGYSQPSESAASSLHRKVDLLKRHDCA